MNLNIIQNKMDITHTLRNINDKCGRFSSLPEHMLSTINKSDFRVHLTQTHNIDTMIVNSFLELIYDEVYIYITIYRMKKTGKTFKQQHSLRSTIIYLR